MSNRKTQSLIVFALCFCVVLPWLARVTTAQKKTAPVEATPPPVREEFKFGKVDLEVLEQVNLLDRRFERDGMVLEDEATNTYLSKIGKSLIPAGLTLENVTWKFRALRDPQPNAFALPNGSIYVTTGLLALMDNESQLAAVLAHELTHVMARHTYLFNRSNRKKFLTMNVIAIVGSVTPGAVGMAISLAASIAPFIVMSTISGYSRDLEREADHRMVDMMISAEYPAEEGINALKLLANDIEGEQVHLFYNDHPELRDRIAYLTSYLGSRADKITPQMELNRERTAYFRQMESAMRHNVQLSINGERFRSALYFAQRLVDFHPDSENLFLLAEAYRTLGPRSPRLTERELTNDAKKDAAKKLEKRTDEEIEREQLATPAGQENWKAHQQKSEEFYRQSLAAENPVAMAHRGLGMLYEKLDKKTEAVAEYEKYLELAPVATDHDRIQRHIENLRRTPQ
jgi:beta-barrel assembly-enhancing protease